MIALPAIALGTKAFALTGQIVFNDEDGKEVLKITRDGEVLVNGELVSLVTGELVRLGAHEHMGRAVSRFAQHWARMMEKLGRGEELTAPTPGVFPPLGRPSGVESNRRSRLLQLIGEASALKDGASADAICDRIEALYRRTPNEWADDE